MASAASGKYLFKYKVPTSINICYIDITDSIHKIRHFLRFPGDKTQRELGFKSIKTKYWIFHICEDYFQLRYFNNTTKNKFIDHTNNVCTISIHLWKCHKHQIHAILE